METLEYVYLDEEGNVHIEWGTKKAFTGLLRELRTPALWLLRAAMLVGSAVQLKYQLLGH